jgi:hypothetical protein
LNRAVHAVSLKVPEWLCLNKTMEFMSWVSLRDVIVWLNPIMSLDLVCNICIWRNSAYSTRCKLVSAGRPSALVYSVTVVD